MMRTAGSEQLSNTPVDGQIADGQLRCIASVAPDMTTSIEGREVPIDPAIEGRRRRPLPAFEVFPGPGPVPAAGRRDTRIVAQDRSADPCSSSGWSRDWSEAGHLVHSHRNPVGRPWTERTCRGMKTR